MQELEDAIQAALTGTTPTNWGNINDDEEANASNKLLGEDGEYDDTRGYTTQQVLKKQKNMLKD